nr:MAG TPA: hypothetical protein [Microviridae sp.]
MFFPLLFYVFIYIFFPIRIGFSVLQIYAFSLKHKISGIFLL